MLSAVVSHVMFYYKNHVGCLLAFLYIVMFPEIDKMLIQCFLMYW